MSAIYADASAVLRVLFAEPGIRMPLRKGIVVASSRLIEVETHRALDRARLLSLLDDAQTAVKSKELRGFLARMHLVPLSDEVVSLAREASGLDFWTHDGRQALAATSRGLEIRGVDLSSVS